MVLTGSEAGREAIRTRVQTTSPATITIPSGTGAGLPNSGFDVKHRAKSSFFITTTGACDVYMQGKARTDGTFCVLQKAEADGDVKHTFAANESAWIHTKAPCRWIRVWVQNTAGADINVTVEHVGGP